MPNNISNADLLKALDGRFTTLQSFLDYLVTRKEPYFFLYPERRQGFVDAVCECCPKTETLTISAADRVCDHVFDLLGSGPTHLSEKIDWHVDFKTGYHFDPIKYYAWFSGDEKYPQEFVAQVRDWIEHNPTQLGVNWTCTMDVAIRVVNWLWGYHFFKGSPSLTDEFLLTFYKSLLVHGCHIRRNLENQSGFTNNHYLADLVGLIYLGILCPEFKEAAEWREFGLRELWQEIFKQVYADGVTFEASIAYHRLTTELLLSPILLCRLNSITVPDEVMARLEKMLEFVMYYTKPDGTVPLIGDNDNGRLHRLKVWESSESEWLDHRYLLAIGAVLFERDDFAQAVGDQWEEAFWLLGKSVMVCKETFILEKTPPPNLGSRAFPDGGIYLMRNDDLYMIIDVGPIGQNGIGGHAHNDVLSFELYSGDRTWIGDPGTYVYTADYETRTLFRSTAYHNTVVLNGQEQNRFDMQNVFSMEDDAQPHVLRWETTQRYDLLVAEHTGYERLPEPVTLRRTIFLDKNEELWLVRDVGINSDYSTGFSLRLHCASSEVIVSNDCTPRLFLTDQSSNRLAIWPIDCTSVTVRIEDGWISRGYGLRQSAPIVCYSWKGACEHMFAYIPGALDDPSTYKRVARALECFNELQSL